jgi:hypothetical protein
VYTIGHRFTRLVVAAEVPSEEWLGEDREYALVCDCGESVRVRTKYLESGQRWRCGRFCRLGDARVGVPALVSAIRSAT